MLALCHPHAKVDFFLTKPMKLLVEAISSSLYYLFYLAVWFLNYEYITWKSSNLLTDYGIYEYDILYGFKY